MIEKMSIGELITEIQYIASIIKDQPSHAAYLADLSEELAKRTA